MSDIELAKQTCKNVTISPFTRRRMMQHEDFGLKKIEGLDIDLSWFKTMPFQEQNSLCFRELPYSTNYNKASTQPFHLHYTSVRDPRFKKLITKVDPQVMTDEKPEVYTEQSYLDIFPKEKIVYLSPDSRYLD